MCVYCLRYAFVKFEWLHNAVRAYEALNNTVRGLRGGGCRRRCGCGWQHGQGSEPLSGREGVHNLLWPLGENGPPLTLGLLLLRTFPPRR